MSRTSRTLRCVARGYTIIELLMSLSVLAIGVTGVISMQRVTVATNRNAKDLSTATRIAEAWADQLAVDASIWTINKAGTSTLASTTWLNLANPNQTVEWFVPAYSGSLGFGPSFGPLGNPLNPTTGAALAHFCTHIRFAFLHSDTAPTAGNGVIRAQIRVFWQREDATTALPTTVASDLCAIDAPTFDANIGSLHVIYLTTAVRQSPQPQGLN